MSKFKKMILVIGAVLTFALALLLGGKIYYDRTVNGYPDTPGYSQKVNDLEFTTSNEKTVLIFHKPGCSDCLAARDTIKSEIKHNHAHIKYIVINVNQAAAKDLMAKYGVTESPTVIYLKGNMVMDSTTSTSQSALQKVMRGN
ncbi:glutaredoxin family protein [Leuconostoc gelidum]|uniref:glutaredoxin family protein n=1 Tax=Leuconostoc gelidum TaxID=1244 RepID=UPI001C7DFC7B|nr:thioredoxin fold domain-containing protein [Leuconostoc gelidum]MBZ6009771.1 thioredoxin fold domain-containing protein [Leuconostoc gelidum subsp. aenigmaticum]